MTKIAIGADVGGTHISTAAVEIETGRVLPGTFFRVTYDHRQPASEVLDAWAGTLRGCMSAVPTGCLGIGMAIPGPFDYRNGISKMQHKFPQLFDYSVRTALLERLGSTDLPIRFLNDATAFAVGEAWVGAGKAVQRVVVITLGTGFGSAFLENGVPVVHANSVPKEGCLWHLPFKEGIADDYFSTRWFISTFEAKRGLRLEGVQALAELAPADKEVQGIFDTFGTNLATCLEQPLRHFSADRLIIGGNIARTWPLFKSAFEKTLSQLNYSISVVPSQLWEQAALIGGARLMDDSFWKKVSADFPIL